MYYSKNYTNTDGFYPYACLNTLITPEDVVANLTTSTGYNVANIYSLYKEITGRYTGIASIHAVATVASTYIETGGRAYVYGYKSGGVTYEYLTVNTTLSTTITGTVTSIPVVSTAGFPSSGYISVIPGNGYRGAHKIQYTSITSTSFNIVSTAIGTWSAGLSVGYAVPITTDMTEIWFADKDAVAYIYNNSLWDYFGKLTTILDTSTSAKYVHLEKPSSVDIRSYTYDGWKNHTGTLHIYGYALLGHWACYGCSKLTEIYCHDFYRADGGVTVGTDSFTGCVNINSIIFNDCGYTTNNLLAGLPLYNLQNVTFKSGIGDDQNDFLADYNVIISKDRTTLRYCGSSKTLPQYVIPSTVTTIKTYAVRNRTSSVDLSSATALTIIEAGAFYTCTGLSSIPLPNTLTTIGAGAFQNCTSATGGLVFPNTVASIGTSAFNGCTGLTGTLTLPTNATLTAVPDGCFTNCKFTGTLIIPSNIITLRGSSTSLGCFQNNRFSSITGLTNITSFGTAVFAGNTLLTTFDDFNSTLLSTGGSTFSGCTMMSKLITFPSTLTAIGDGAFTNCTSLPKPSFNNVLQYIGASAFSGCSAMTGDLIIPDSVSTIGFSCFYQCAGLTGILHLPTGGGLSVINIDTFWGCRFTGNCDIPSSVVTIGYRSFLNVPFTGGTLNFLGTSSLTTIRGAAFSGCKFSGTITIPTTVTNMDYSSTYSYGVFQSCTNITSVVVPSGITSLPQNVFAQCTALTYNSSMLASNITSIGSNAFANCTSLAISNLVILDTVTSIGAAAFYCCTMLTGSVTLPTNATYTTIQPSTFYGCTGITSVTIPSYITAIGTGTTSSGQSFEGCTNLASLNILGIITYLGYRSFYNCTNLSLDVSNILPNVTTIGSGIFYNCYNVYGNIQFNSAITIIPDSLFFSCINLNGTLTLPPALTSIGTNAFYIAKITGAILIPATCTIINVYGLYLAATSNITRVDINRTSPPTVTVSNSFRFQSGVPLHVKSGATGFNVAPWTTTTIFSSVTADL